MMSFPVTFVVPAMRKDLPVVAWTVRSAATSANV